MIGYGESHTGTWRDTATLIASGTLYRSSLNNTQTIGRIDSTRTSRGRTVDADRRQRWISDKGTESRTGRIQKRRVGLDIDVPATHSVRTLNEDTDRKSLTVSNRNTRRTSRTTGCCCGGCDTYETSQLRVSRREYVISKEQGNEKERYRDYEALVFD